jgi:hypothetical protein
MDEVSAEDIIKLNGLDGGRAAALQVGFQGWDISSMVRRKKRRREKEAKEEGFIVLKGPSTSSPLKGPATSKTT